MLYHIRKSEKNLPEGLMRHITSLHSRFKIRHPTFHYAAFDLDNTLLLGDIGEAVFALLVKKGLIKGFGWKEYLSLVEKNKVKAYKYIIDLMQGIELAKLEALTHEVIKSKSSTISLEGYKIAIPKPNTKMKSIVELLREMGIVVYVVTASNEVSARIICTEYFGIPHADVIGAEVAYNKEGIIKKGTKEFPYGEGKVTILKMRFSNKPIVTGGDSPGDKYLLDYTAKRGIKLKVEN